MSPELCDAGGSLASGVFQRASPALAPVIILFGFLFFSSSRSDPDLRFDQRWRVRRVVMNGTHLSPFCISPMIVIESADWNW